MKALTGALATLFCLGLCARAPAQSDAEKLAFERAETAGTAELWEAFLAAHPKGTLVKQARKQLDAALHQLAKQAEASRDGKDGAEPSLSHETAAKTIGKLYKRCRTPEGADRLFVLWDHAAWAAAKAVDTELAYRAYLLRFPGGKHSREAQPAIDGISWRRCKAANTAAAYRDFLKRHPVSRYASEARKILALLDYAEVRQLDSIEAYEKFLKKNRTHKAAQDRLAFLMYQAAVDSGKLADWSAFKKRFRFSPSRYRGRRVRTSKLPTMLANASREIERLLYAEVIADPTLKRCQEYLKEFPRGLHKPQVMVRMEEGLYDSVTQKNSAAGYLDYLGKYRMGYRHKDIIARLEPMIFRQLPIKETFQTFSKYTKIYPKRKQEMLDKMAPYMHAWAKRVRTERAYETYIRWYAPTRTPWARSKPTGKAEPRPSDALTAEIFSLLDPFLWKKAKASDWHTEYKAYLRRLPKGVHVVDAKKRLEFLTTNKAVFKLSAPVAVKRVSGKWSWKTQFNETGGKIGYRLKGSGWIYNSKGAKYGIRYGYTYGSAQRIGRGSVKVKAGGKASDSYRLSDSRFVGGHVLFTWTGEDAGGHKISLVERVQLK